MKAWKEMTDNEAKEREMTDRPIGGQTDNGGQKIIDGKWQTDQTVTRPDSGPGQTGNWRNDNERRMKKPNGQTKRTTMIEGQPVEDPDGQRPRPASWADGPDGQWPAQTDRQPNDPMTNDHYWLIDPTQWPLKDDPAQPDHELTQTDPGIDQLDELTRTDGQRLLTRDPSPVMTQPGPSGQLTRTSPGGRPRQLTVMTQTLTDPDGLLIDPASQLIDYWTDGPSSWCDSW